MWMLNWQWKLGLGFAAFLAGSALAYDVVAKRDKSIRDEATRVERTVWQAKKDAADKAAAAVEAKQQAEAEKLRKQIEEQRALNTKSEKEAQDKLSNLEATFLEKDRKRVCWSAALVEQLRR